MKEAAKYYEENMKMFGELRLVPAITKEQVEIMRDPERAPTAKQQAILYIERNPKLVRSISSFPYIVNSLRLLALLRLSLLAIMRAAASR
jgi:hypothetical protein